MIGCYIYSCTGGKQKTTGEFLMADRQMSWFPVALSLLASFMSAITLLGTPAEVYVYGTQYCVLAISYMLVVPASAHLFVPIFYRLGLTSTYEVRRNITQGDCQRKVAILSRPEPLGGSHVGPL